MLDREDLVRRWGWVFLAACAMVVFLGADAAYVARDRWVDAQRSTQAAGVSVPDVRSVVAASDARTIIRDVPGGGRVSVVVSTTLGQALVLLAGLPEVGTDTAYQLWAVTGDVAVPAADFGGGERSGTRLVRDLGAADSLELTREPVGGSRVPTPPALVDIPLRG